MGCDQCQVCRVLKDRSICYIPQNPENLQFAAMGFSRFSRHIFEAHLFSFPQLTNIQIRQVVLLKYP